MFRNYILIGFRSLQKHRFYSLINIAGLGLGLASCLLLVAWVFHELSYDRFHAKAPQIYRASLEYSFGGQTSKTSVSPTALLPMLEKNFPEVENGVRVYNPSARNPFIVRQGEEVFQEDKFLYADSTFFQIFNFPLLKGDPSTALREPNTVILTESAAMKYFGNEDAVGKSIQVNNRVEYLITGIAADPPSNSIQQFDFIASFASLDASKKLEWWSANYSTYLILSPSTNIQTLTAKTQDIVQKAVSDDMGQSGDYVKYNFIPYTDIYLRSDMDESVPVSDIQYVYIFAVVALLLLIIACINYINLATARASERAKEVGIRKVIGALRNQLFVQFLGESLIITLISLCVSFIFAKLALPSFNALTGKQFTSSMIFNPQFVGMAFVVSLLIALAAGAYPALAITSFKPVQVLKGNFKTSSKGIWLRQSLVVFQFSISIILIIGTLVVIKQLDYIQNKKLGYEKDNVIVLPLDRQTKEVYQSLKNELIKTGNVAQIARATESPTAIAGGYSISAEGTHNEKGIIVTAMAIDENFIPALNMELAAGRNLTENDMLKAKTDTVYSFILNASALRELGLETSKAPGTKVNLNGRTGEIIGVLNDFHFAPLQKKITPLVLFNEESDFSFMFVTLKAGNTTAAIASIKEACKTLAPHRPFEYTFLDEKYNTLYDNEQRMGKLSTTFAVLTIIIACLGLLGLVSFSAAQKTKEIGIRKVMGASPASIVVLITKDFTRLVIISIVIGIPVGYWITNRWLDGFAYRTEVGVLPFAGAALLCLLIAFGTASYQSIKSALINPADTLRSE